VLLWAAVSTALAALSAAAPRVWALPAAALTTAALVAWSGWSLVRPFAVLTLLPVGAAPHHDRLALQLPAPAGGPAPWTAIVATLVVGAAAASLLRHLPTPGAREAAGRAWVALGPAALALGAATCLLENGPTLLVAVLVWCAPLAIASAMALTVRHQDAPLAASLLFAAYLVGTGLRLTAPSHLLSAAFATAVALVLAFAHTRADSRPLAGMLQPLLAGATVLSTAYAAAHWAFRAGAGGDAVGVVVVAVAALALLAARPVGRGGRGRIAIEITGFLTGLAATAFPDDPAVVATVLTLLGSAVAVVTVLNRDRDEAAWIGVALLGVATAIRVVDDVRAPELYTLPAAAVLLGAGWWRLTHDARIGSVRALSSGLTLALVPSLLLALDEPVSLRGVLVAAAGVAAVAVGIARLWAAPFVAGAATTGALAVRHLGPVVDGLPRWISLGSLGLALLLVGITWEQRRRDAEAASRYLASLR